MVLTDAGRTYVEHARVAVAYGEGAMKSRRPAATGRTPFCKSERPLTQTQSSSRSSTRFAFLCTRILEISVHSEPSSDLAHDLLIADLDLAIITNPAKNPKLTMNKLVETPLHIVLPREHPLSSKASVKLFDLRNEGWIVFQKRLHPILYDRIMKRTHDEGFEPRRLDHILYADEAEHMLTAAPERCIP